MGLKVGDRVEHTTLSEKGIIEKIYRATGDINRTIRLDTGFYAPEEQFQKPWSDIIEKFNNGK